MDNTTRNTQDLLNHFNIDIEVNNNPFQNNNNLYHKNLLNKYISNYAGKIVDYTNNNFTKKEKANLVLEIICGMNMYQINTWVNEIIKVDPSFYKTHLSLSAGQQKLLIQEIFILALGAKINCKF